MRALLEGVTDEALADAVRHVAETDTSEWPEELTLRNGASVFEGPGTVRYSTDEQFRAESGLRAAAVERGAEAVTPEQATAIVEAYAAAGRPLGVDQAAALHGVLTSGARVEVLSAAPGTGKSFVVGALAEAWIDTASDRDRRVFGLAPSQVAAGVLDRGGRHRGDEHHRMARRAAPARRQTRAADEAWRLRRGDLVVVDEANMTSTEQLAEIQQRCEAAGAKLLLVGDPRQLAAVGPGGALADIAEHGLRYELAEVRRFADEWERAASLRLRDGDTTVLDEYDKHGRLRDGGTAEQAEAAASRAWLADTLPGKESLLMVGDNTTAARVSAALRAELVDARPGRPRTASRSPWTGGRASSPASATSSRPAATPGTSTATRATTRAPINRETYRVVGVRADGGLTVAPILGPRRRNRRWRGSRRAAAAARRATSPNT